MSTDADDASFVEVLGCIFAHIRDIGSEFLSTALGFAHFEDVFIHMNRGQDILGHHTLVEHNGVLVVVTFPRHVSHLKVASKGKFAVFG